MTNTRGKPESIKFSSNALVDNFDFKPIQGFIKQGTPNQFLRAFDDSNCTPQQQKLKEEIFAQLSFAQLSAHVAHSVAFRGPTGHLWRNFMVLLIPEISKAVIS